jgi:hypothetical protein
MVKTVSVLLVILLACDLLVVGGVDSKKAAFVGGTATQVKQGKDPVEGVLNTEDEMELRFVYGKTQMEQTFAIPYSRIYALDFGHSAGQKAGPAAAAAALGPVALIFFKFKKKKRFLTIYYKDSDGKEQFAVFELGKDAISSTLANIERRSGKKVEYQDEEAEKVGTGRN